MNFFLIKRRLYELLALLAFFPRSFYKKLEENLEGTHGFWEDRGPMRSTPRQRDDAVTLTMFKVYVTKLGACTNAFVGVTSIFMIYIYTIFFKK